MMCLYVYRFFYDLKDNEECDSILIETSPNIYMEIAY